MKVNEMDISENDFNQSKNEKIIMSKMDEVQE